MLRFVVYEEVSDHSSSHMLTTKESDAAMSCLRSPIEPLNFFCASPKVKGLIRRCFKKQPDCVRKFQARQAEAGKQGHKRNAVSLNTGAAIK